MRAGLKTNAFPIPLPRLLLAFAPVLLIGLYLATRLLGLALFVPHNDEVIHIDFAQIIASDWNTKKFLTLDGSVGDEFKMPLQFWLGAATPGIFTAPLNAARFWPLAFGLAGFVFFSLFVARLWDARAGVITAGLILFSEYYFYFDSVAVTEALVYGCGAAYLFFLYEAITSGRRSRLVVYTGLGTCALFAAILAKESGILFALPAALLPLLISSGDSGPPAGPRPMAPARRLLLRGAPVAFTIVAAKLLLFITVTGRFQARRNSSLQAGMVRGPAELLELPIGEWYANARFYFGTVLTAEFSLWLAPIVLLLIFTLLRLRRENPDGFRRLSLLGLLYGTTFVPLILVAETRFVRIFGMGLYFLHGMIAVALSFWLAEPRAKYGRAILLGAIILFLSGKIPSTWRPLFTHGQTELGMRETTDGWAQGLGIKRLTGHLAGLPPGLLIYDNRWGHPGTAVRVFRAGYPQLEIAPAKGRLLVRLDAVLRLLDQENKELFFVFDYAPGPGARPLVQAILSQPRLCAEKTVFEKRFKDRILPNRIVLCRSAR